MKKLILSFTFFAAALPALRVDLPGPPQELRIFASSSPVTRFVDVIRNIFVPAFCPAEAPRCVLSINDVSDPSNNFRLDASCTGGNGAPCALAGNGTPQVGAFRGSLAAFLNIGEMGVPAVIYDLKDPGGQSCGTAIAHVFSAGGGAPPPVTPPVNVPVSTYDQSAYRWFANADSVTPGAAQAAQNTPFAPGMPARLRLLIHVADAPLAAGAQAFKLQWGLKGASCADAVYSDLLPGSGAMRFFDNGSVADDAATALTADDPTHGADARITQTYQEANDFTPVAPVNAGEDGLWDFSVGSGGGSFGSFCFRAVKADGTPLDTYEQYPELTCTGEGGC